MLFALVLLFGVAVDAAVMEVTATFTLANSDVVGWVRLHQNGTLDIDLDLSAADLMGATSLTYHIHKNWSDANPDSKTCGFAATDNHWDPTLACGANSGNPLCDTCDTPTYACDYEANPWSCEVGDLSGKYGAFPAAGGAIQVDDFMGALPKDVVGQSIVFHGGGSRLFCAQFVETTPATPAPARTLPGMGHTAVAHFVSAESWVSGWVKFWSDGTHQVELDVSNAADLCPAYTGLKYHVHAKWTNMTHNSTYGSMCGGPQTGGHYDPTLACSAVSDNVACACRENHTYSCDPSTNPYSCEVSDTSAIYGTLDADGSNMVVKPRTAIMDAWSAIALSSDEILGQGLSVVFHCNDGSRAFCSKFVMDSMMTTTTSMTTTGMSTSTTTGMTTSTTGTTTSSTGTGTGTGTSSTTAASGAAALVPGLFVAVVAALYAF